MEITGDLKKEYLSSFPKSAIKLVMLKNKSLLTDCSRWCFLDPCSKINKVINAKASTVFSCRSALCFVCSSDSLINVNPVMAIFLCAVRKIVRLWKRNKYLSACCLQMGAGKETKYLWWRSIINLVLSHQFIVLSKFRVQVLPKKNCW